MNHLRLSLRKSLHWFGRIETDTRILQFIMTLSIMALQGIEVEQTNVDAKRPCSFIEDDP